jgi:cytochrome c553
MKQSVQNQTIKMFFVLVFFIGCTVLINCTPEQKQPEVVGNQSIVTNNTVSNSETSLSLPLANPVSYKSNCAECHGDKGEGIKASPELIGLTTREEERRSDEDLLGIINNPKSFGLSSKMKSYKDKLTEDEKQEIIRWMKSLK